MKESFRTSLRVLTLSALAAALFRPAAAEGLADAVREAKFNVDWRVRHEAVDQEDMANTADALTSRFRGGLTTGAVGGTSLQMEAVLVTDIVDDYNSTLNGRVQYPVVPDPAEFAAVNRFAFINKSLPKTTLTLGRQRIVLDDHRFVGNVGWRQHEQTYDALRASRAGAVVKMDLSYADQVNRIFGPDSPAGNWHGDLALMNFSFTKPWGTVTLFDYWLDLEDAAAASTNTVGLRFTGSKPLGSLTGLYTLSYAMQEDAGNNPASFSEHSYSLEGGLKLAKFTASLGYELLSGNGAASFQTPLATLHAFQGWADKFLATPAAGIEDSYVKLAYQTGALGPFSGVAALAVFHDFGADLGAASYGDELDLQLVARTERLTLTLKYASYSAEALFTDTDKVWLSMDYAF